MEFYLKGKNMEIFKELKTYIEIAQIAPFFAVFYFLWKSGAIKIGNGKKNGYQCQIDDLKKHADVANKEMGDIRKDISQIQKDVSFIRGKLSK